MPKFEQPMSTEGPTDRERLLVRLHEELGPDADESKGQLKEERVEDLKRLRGMDVSRLVEEADAAIKKLGAAIDKDADVVEIYDLDLRLKDLADLLAEKGTIKPVGDASLQSLIDLVRQRIDEAGPSLNKRGEDWENLER